MCYLQPQINQSWQATTSRSDSHSQSLNLCVLSVGTQSISQISATAGMPQTAHNQSVARNVAVVLPLELSISLTLTLFVYVARSVSRSVAKSVCPITMSLSHARAVWSPLCRSNWPAISLTLTLFVALSLTNVFWGLPCLPMARAACRPLPTSRVARG